MAGFAFEFGGHAMAAGLSIKRVHLPRFQKAFDKAVRAMVTPDMMDAVLLTDGALAKEDLNLDTVAVYKRRPMGHGLRTIVCG